MQKEGLTLEVTLQINFAVHFFRRFPPIRKRRITNQSHDKYVF